MFPPARAPGPPRAPGRSPGGRPCPPQQPARSRVARRPPAGRGGRRCRAWMDGAIRTPDRSPAATHRPLSGRSSPSSISIDSVSSTKSGLPSAASWMRDATAGSSVASPSRFSISRSDWPGDRGSRISVTERLRARRPARAQLEQLVAGHGQEQQRRRRATGRRRTRPGRAASARPSGDRRARPRAAASRASVSNSLRTPQKPSSADAPASTNPISSATRSAARVPDSSPASAAVDLLGRDGRVVVVGDARLPGARLRGWARR